MVILIGHILSSSNFINLKVLDLRGGYRQPPSEEQTDNRVAAHLKIYFP